MYAAEIKDGIVVNRILSDESFARENGYVPCEESVGIGYLYNPETGFSEPEPAYDDLVLLVNIQKELIRRSFSDHNSSGISINDILWNSGSDSAFKLINVVDMARRSGLNKVTLYASDNSAHELKIKDAEAIALAISAEYQRLLAIKQDCMKKLDGIDLSEKDGFTMRDRIQSVKYSVPESHSPIGLSKKKFGFSQVKSLIKRDV